jgi:hypothetical protein
VHLAWRWSYYGYPFPNSYYAKIVGDDAARRLARGIRELWSYLYPSTSSAPRPFVVWLALALACLGLWRARSRLFGETLVWWGTLLVLVGFRVAFHVWSGSESMGHRRFLAPALVPLLIMADEGARRIGPALGRLVLAAALGAGLYFNVEGHRRSVQTWRSYAQGLQRAHIPLGRWLRESRPKDATVAIGDAGVVGFFSRLRLIDLWGLNDRAIAHLEGRFGQRPRTAEYVLRRRPELIVLGSSYRPGEPRAFAFDQAIAEHPAFQSDYRFVRSFVFKESGPERLEYHLDVFERR